MFTRTLRRQYAPLLKFERDARRGEIGLWRATEYRIPYVSDLPKASSLCADMYPVCGELRGLAQSVTCRCRPQHSGYRSRRLQHPCAKKRRGWVYWRAGMCGGTRWKFSTRSILNWWKLQPIRCRAAGRIRPGLPQYVRARDAVCRVPDVRSAVHVPWKFQVRDPAFQA